jgi:hypothetical protein
VVVGVLRHVVVALFYGSLYWRMEPTAVLSRMSLLFFTIMFIMVGNQQSIPPVYEDRLLYYREKGASVYGAYSYWMTCATSYIPQIFVNTLTYSVILYFMTGLHNTAGMFSALANWHYWGVSVCLHVVAPFCQSASATSGWSSCYAAPARCPSASCSQWLCQIRRPRLRYSRPLYLCLLHLRDSSCDCRHSLFGSGHGAQTPALLGGPSRGSSSMSSRVTPV